MSNLGDVTEVTDNKEATLDTVVKQIKTVRLVDPKEYKHGNNFAQWCSRFRRDLKIGRIDKGTAIETFLNSLDDRTAEKLEPVADRMTEEERRDPELFIGKFEQTMFPQAEIRSLRQQLTNGSLKQEHGEDIDSFAARIRNISHRAYPDTATRAEPSLNALLNGMHDDLYERIISSTEAQQDFEAAVTTAMTYEKMRRLREPARVLRMTQGQNETNDRDRRAIDQNEGWRNGDRRNSQNRGTRREQDWRHTRICWNCDKEGHIARFCREQHSFNSQRAFNSHQSLNSNRAGRSGERSGPRQ